MPNTYRLPANGLAALLVTITAAAIFILNGCGSNTDSPPTRAEILEQGAALSKKYCANCHQYPKPALLDNHIWETSVLPAMALKLGFQSEMGQLYADKQSLINIIDWQKIVEYYKANSPKKLEVPKPNAVTDWAIFKLQRPLGTNKSATAMTTLARYNPFNKTLYTADAANNVYSWDASLRPALVAKLPSPVSYAEFFKTAEGKNTGVFTSLGVMPPNDYLKGSLNEVQLDGKHVVTTLADSLPRPVQLASGDFNKDGLTDYIVCGFGNEKGALFLVQQQPNHKFVKKVIRAVPGAIQLEMGDFNNDGWPDFLCQFAQADEGLWLFLNDKQGGFKSQNLLRFPPVYGTYSFQLVDMNNDDKKDIIYICGDNNDLSPILKPYHGVYIFTNQGNCKFKQTYFYHLNGASKAIAADFDGDGDMDIANIAFFPDFKNTPQEGFTYMEQTGKGKFKAHNIPINTEGRWLVMDAADLDGDGDLDIVLGNFSIYEEKLLNQKDFKPNWNAHQPIIVLQNTSKKP
ncbi:VCBS repeat-containing protein [Inquilinus sp. KBS0705]|nr:VCBS repeat-containing protein [Inquilinus sp. KBS0705]